MLLRCSMEKVHDIGSGHGEGHAA